MKVIVTGSLSFDHIFNLPGKFSDYILPEKIHQINISFATKSHQQTFGGTGGNQAYTFSLLGIKPILLATAGGNFAPYKKYLKKHQVDTSYIKIYPKENTACGFVITDRADNQIWGFSKGAMCAAAKLKITMQNLKSSWKDLFVVIAPNEPKAIANYIDECLELKIPFSFDPAFYIPDLPASVLEKGVKYAQIIFGNDYEIASLNAKLKCQISKLQLKAKNSSILVTTLGERGSVVNLKDLKTQRLKEIKIKPVKPKKLIDPTGAGDAYRAGFLAGYLRGLALKTCGQMGSTAASFAIEKYGTMNHYFSRETFKKRYEKNFAKLKM